MTHQEFIDNYLEWQRYYIKDNILYVRNDVFLYRENIDELPDNLNISGSLDLEDCTIYKLPNNLTISGLLNLGGTYITELPDNLIIKRIFSDKKLEMCERLQLQLISNNKWNITIINNPTKNAITLHKLLWEL